VGAIPSGQKWHAMRVEDLMQALNTDHQGLSETAAKHRLEEIGPNELREIKKITPLEIFLRQFKSILVIILLIATAISAFLGEFNDALIIAIIVLLNAVLGFAQEYRAERSMEALKRLTAPKTRVIRDGKDVEILAKELVPGDIILLKTGDRVPADSRLIEAMNLQVNEAPLTGESLPVEKTIATMEEGIPTAEKKNMVFMATDVTYGRGKAIVVATGMNTEVGKIAEKIQTAPPRQTPLQIRLEQFGKWIGLTCLIICAIVFLTQILRGQPFFQMFIISVSLAVAAIPEGLPAIVTVSLAIGMQRMAKRNAIIRKLSAVETLGCATVICSDKTGTLTSNEMSVRKLYTNNKMIEVIGEGYEPKGEFRQNGMIIDPLKDGHTALLLRIVTLCNDASLIYGGKKWRVEGDPTEGALLVAAAKAGVNADNIKKQYPRIAELPFSSERKLMTTIHTTPEGEKVAYVKGAPENVLELCTHIYESGQMIELSEKDKETLLEINQTMAGEALRVLAMAYKSLPETLQNFTPNEVETNLVFVGLAGMIDAPRAEAKIAIKVCEDAGIKVIMITGDHKLTATAVAKELGLLKSGRVLTGAELDALSDGELEEIAEDVTVYARVSPEHKLRIVKALKKRGHIVAMTGDGVNDAPALKMADIGTAMGITGTDVAKEASDMVLADDNFATIVSAIEEGRQIYDNIRKSIAYLLSSNSGEILVMFVGALMGLPPPLLAAQILWINLVTDGAPALALGADPAAPDLMQRPPRDPKEKVLSRTLLLLIVSVGIVMCVGTLALFNWELAAGVAWNRARTMAFTVLVMFQMFNVLNCRSEKHSLFKIGFLSNKYLMTAIAISILLQMAVIYIPPLQLLFETVPLSAIDWIVVTLISAMVFVAVEIGKFANLVWGRRLTA
jgi:Ca2+-transporting ATPase